MDKTIVETYLQKLQEKSTQQLLPIEGWKVRIADYVEANVYNYLTEWEALTGNELFPQGKTIWMVNYLTIPNDLVSSNDSCYLFFCFEHVEGILRIDDRVYHGIDRNRHRIPLKKEFAGKTIKLSLELFSREKDTGSEIPYFRYSYLGCVSHTLEQYYYDLKMAWDSYNLDNVLLKQFSGDLDAAQNVLNHSLKGYIKPLIMRAIDKSLQYLDISLSGDALIEAVGKANQILRTELGSIQDGDSKGHVSLIGHTHIDVAWLWQLKDTVRKCGHSFANMLRLMEQYPEFTFSCSQPQLYAYTKEFYPEIYREIKKYVAEGRWELVGPMWVESDCNVVSGESLIRQILYGRAFFMKEFGKSSNICWLPDTFGFQGNMPQILKKSGIAYFFSYKLHWQAANRFPYGSFIWQGIDGSQVTASVPELVSGYNGNPVPAEVKYAQDANLQKDKVDDVIFPYGWGDGGGGPTPEMVEYARRLGNQPGLPKCSMDKAADFFGRLELQKETLPVWYGELSLETHRGTLTTHGDCKKMNRKMEILYQQIEKLGVLAQMTGCQLDWSQVQKGWEEILLLQFHDILPGSSIHEVYQDAEVIYNRINSWGREALEEILGHMAGVKNAAAKTIMAVNTLSWERTDYLEIPYDGDNTDVGVEDARGEWLPAVVRESGDGGRILAFTAKNIPSLGFMKYRVAGNPSVVQKDTATVTNTPEGLILESDRYSMKLDAEGRIVNLFDRSSNRIVVSQPANEFRLFMDGPQGEDAWNIYSEYRDRPLTYDWNTAISIEENNSVRTVVNITKKAPKVSIRQQLILYRAMDRIDFVTKIDWHEKHKVLKVAFPVDIHTPQAAFDTGFGVFNRPTYANNPFEQEKFEVAGHKWVDLSEGEYGVTLINDCKYGHDVQGNTMSITLLRATTSPDHSADMGMHDITYTLYPHQEDWRKALSVRRGYEVNTPLYSAPTEENHAASASWISVDNENIILDTIKPAEDGNGFIVRLYECNGNRGRGTLHTAFEIAQAAEIDLMEAHVQSVAFEKSHLCFDIKPYEIKTFRIIV